MVRAFGSAIKVMHLTFKLRYCQTVGSITVASPARTVLVEGDAPQAWPIAFPISFDDRRLMVKDGDILLPIGGHAFVAGVENGDTAGVSEWFDALKIVSEVTVVDHQTALLFRGETKREACRSRRPLHAAIGHSDS